MGLNTLLKQLGQRHGCEDVFSIDLRSDQFSVPSIGSFASFRQAAQRPDGQPLFSSLFGDNSGQGD